MKQLLILFITAMLALVSCQQKTPHYTYDIEEDQQQQQTASSVQNIKVTKSVTIPSDGSTPVAGFEEVDQPDRLITLTEVGEKFEVMNGQVVNLIYDGIDPEETYIIFESTFDGYTLELAYREDPIAIRFNELCQTFIVASPELTSIRVPDDLRYEQIVWTPREDGTWEVRIGTTERGCKSRALNKLNSLRDTEYEKDVPRKK
jgi:hypothetical protein